MAGKRALTIAGLRARGYAEVPSTSRKYTVFAIAGCDRKYLIGKAGGLRVVRDGQPIADSVSLTDTLTHRLFQKVGAMAPHLTTREQANAIYFEKID